MLIDSWDYTSLQPINKIDGVILKLMKAHSIYLHIPFCQQRCGYCDFNTYAGLSQLIKPYVAALAKEIAYSGEHSPDDAKTPVHTVFLGGGTPSLLSPSQINILLETIEEHFHLLPGSEISMEANPGTVSPDNLKGYRQAGINRLSIGVQSANPDELRLLDRQHGFREAVETLEIAREAGFEMISFDLIYGLPGQTVAAWEKSLNAVLSLNPNHLSLYALSVEEGTPLHRQVEQGQVDEPDPDSAADIYEWTIDFLATISWEQYEISNWAQRDQDGNLMLSRHNVQYWLNQPYYGFGAGAHGFVNGFRTENILFPLQYIEAMNKPSFEMYPITAASLSANKINKFTEMQETMMMGLRLVQQGVSRERFTDRFGEDFAEVFSSEISELLQKELVEWMGAERHSLRLAKKARILGNQVFRYFV